MKLKIFLQLSMITSILISIYIYNYESITHKTGTMLYPVSFFGTWKYTSFVLFCIYWLWAASLILNAVYFSTKGKDP